MAASETRKAFAAKHHQLNVYVPNEMYAKYVQELEEIGIDRVSTDIIQYLGEVIRKEGSASHRFLGKTKRLPQVQTPMKKQAIVKRENLKKCLKKYATFKK